MSFLADLISNVLGGVAAALIITWWLGKRDEKRRLAVRNLVDAMGKMIEYRNAGKEGKFADEATWKADAKKLIDDAQARAYALSVSAGAQVEWLDRIDPYPRGNERGYWESMLSKAIERIRGILERTD
jgi:hypothetical protein